MTKQENQFLDSVRIILIRIGAIKSNIVLDAKSWLILLKEGMNPLEAVKADMDCELPFIKWSDVAHELKLL